MSGPITALRKGLVRTMGAFICALAAVLFVVLMLTNQGGDRVLTGSVGNYVSGEWISVANETTDPAGVQIAVRGATTVERDPALIKTGDVVTVWYRTVGERRPVADRVRVLTAAGANPK